MQSKNHLSSLIYPISNTLHQDEFVSTLLQKLNLTNHLTLDKQFIDNSFKIPPGISSTTTTSRIASNLPIQLFGLHKKYKTLSSFKTPQQIAQFIVDHLQTHIQPQDFVKSIDISKKGHINFELSVEFEKKPLIEKKKTSKSTKKSEMLSFDQQQEIIQRELEVKFAPAEFDQEEFELYKQYQMKVHGDKESECTPSQYEGFLCETSLVLEESTSENRLPFDQGLGTFHIQYRVKKTNKLIAVSVVDILPTGLSSVYFFYDLEYRFLSLGIFSVLHEIGLIQKEHKLNPKFQYLYLGFYIHSCQKMRYKAQYEPSELLCPVTHNWVPYKEIQEKKLLDDGEYAKFSDKEVKEFEFDIGNTTCFIPNIGLVKLSSIQNELSEKVLKSIRKFWKSNGAAANDIYYILA